MSQLRAGVLQSSGAYADLSARLQELERALIAQPELDLLVCPELFVSGYFMQPDECRKAAKTANGAYRQAIGTLATRHQTAIVYGYPEAGQNSDEGNHYNAAACVSATGELIANHRKLALPPGFEHDLFSRGSQHTLFDLGDFRCAILICYDAEFPENVRQAALSGANVIIVPTALTSRWPVVAEKMMPTRAFENGVWLLYANGAADHHDTDRNLQLCGLSAIVQPDGHDAARAEAHPKCLAATLDLKSARDAQARLPYLLDQASLSTPA